MTTFLVLAWCVGALVFLTWRYRDEMRRTHKPSERDRLLARAYRRSARAQARRDAKKHAPKHLAERVGLDLDAEDRRAHGWADPPPPPPYCPTNLWTRKP